VPTPVDRWIAVVAPVATAVVLVAAAVLGAGAELAAPALPPAPVPDDSSRAVRTDLLERTGRSERAVWLVRYEFERETPAGPLRARTVNVRRPPDVLTAAFGTLRGRWKGRTVDCVDGPGGRVCASPARARLGRTAGPLAAATEPGSGPYTVQAAGSVRVAGERGRCFRLVANGRPGRPVFGLEADRCLTRDGLVLRDVVRRADSRDVSTARRVRRTVSDRDFTRLLRGYPMGSDPPRDLP
jgi:hypothetical protein